MRNVAVCVALIYLALAPTGAVLARSEIPIREVVLSDGERRYGVSIKVGGTTIELARFV